VPATTWAASVTPPPGRASSTTVADGANTTLDERNVTLPATSKLGQSTNTSPARTTAGSVAPIVHGPE